MFFAGFIYWHLHTPYPLSRGEPVTISHTNQIAQYFLNPVVFPVSAAAIIFGCGTYFKPLRQPLLLSAAATGNR